MDAGEVRYAKSGDLSIAYQVWGDGPVDLVMVPGFVTHRDLMWDLPGAHLDMSEGLGRFARVLSFDKRGTGLSDRSLGLGTVEDRMDDVRAVMDAAGFERSAILGISEGGPLALTFAATYPDRVSQLILFGTFARVAEAPDYPDGLPAGTVEAFPGYLEARWGTGQPMRVFLQGVAEDEATNRLLGRFERSACTPGMAAEIMRHNIAIDVRSVLPVIGVPTLILHHRGDPVVPLRAGEYLARHIEGAEITVLDGDEHMGPETRAVPELVEQFLTGRTSEAVPDRVLATVLFTDIVGSTERAAGLGDAAWRDVLDRHDAVTRREVESARGRVVKTTGDGCLAIFDGPARAVRCAQAIDRAVSPLGIQVRAGLHTGECELRGDDVAGIAVHLGARVGSLAGAGEVLVTSTVRDLTLGSGIEFTDRGQHQLKGVPGEWQVLSVTG